MIGEVVDFINTELKTLSFVKETRKICEIIEINLKGVEGNIVATIPAEYCGKGKLDHVTDIDKTGGLIYHRINGATERVENEDANGLGCDVYIEQTYPMLLVAAVKKSLTGQDVNAIDTQIADTIMNNITTSNVSSLQKLLSLDTVTIMATEANVNRYEVFAEEYTNIDFNIDFEYAYMAIQYTVMLSGQLSCFENLCD